MIPDENRIGIKNIPKWLPGSDVAVENAGKNVASVRNGRERRTNVVQRARADARAIDPHPRSPHFVRADTGFARSPRS